MSMSDLTASRRTLQATRSDVGFASTLGRLKRARRLFSPSVPRERTHVAPEWSESPSTILILGNGSAHCGFVTGPVCFYLAHESREHIPQERYLGGASLRICTNVIL